MLLIHPHQDPLYLLFTFSFYSVSFSLSKVVEVYRRNIDSSLLSIQPGILNSIVCIYFTYAVLSLAFPRFILINCSMSCSNSYILNGIHISQVTG